MDKKEMEIMEKAIREKYRFHTFWKVLAIVFMVTTVIFAVLYFGSGDIFKQDINNDVEVVNEGDGNNTNSVVINN